VAILLAVLSIAAATITLGGRQPANAGDAERWQRAHRAAVKYRRQRDHLQELLTRRVLQVRRQTRALARKPQGSRYAIRLASSTFRVSEREMLAVASCETGGTFDESAHNPSSSAAGLFQFLDSTWANQGLAGFSVYDPVANALAAARIVAREGWSQWECKP
jgi:hypothetical protein